MPVVPSRALPQAWHDEVIDISDDMEMEQYEIQEEKDKEQEMEVACTRAPKTNRVTISMSIIKDLLGESVKIPMKVKVDVPGEGERQLMWLRKNSLDYGVLYFAQPLFSKIKSCQPCFRKWSLSESGGSDGIPCLTLELGRAEMLPEVETAAPKRRTKVGASVTPLRGISAMGSKWFAQISFKGKNHYLGTYSTAEEAARAYDSAAYYLKGPKAVLNFPNDLQPISNDLKARICAHSPAGGDQEPSQSQERVEEEVEEEEDEEEEEEDEEEDEEEEEVDEREIEVASSKPRNLITVNMSLVRGLLGESVKLPIKVKVDVSGEDARQLVWLRKNSEIRGAFYFDEPVLSKIKSCSFQQRKWSRSESGGSDGMPCLSLELGANHTPAAGEGLTTRFRGVYFFGRRWKALVSAQGRNWHLGSHATAEEAARVYDSAAYYFKGAQARLNFPDEQPRPLSDELKNKLDAAAQGNLMGSEVNEEQKDVEAEEEEEGDQEGIVNGDDDKMTKKRRRRKTWRGVMSGDEGDGNDDVMDVEEEDARAPFSHRNRVGIALSTVMMLLGESVKLPIKVMVDVPGAGERQLLWLKQKNSTQASLYFTDPLLSKIKSCNFQQRKWSLVESGGLDGIPCLSLELGNNDTAAAGVGLTTRFRGVSALGSRWSAHIWANSKAWYLGSHSTAEEAARVYDSAAYYFKGAQARLNFPDEQPQPLSDELKNKLGAAAQGYLVGRRIKVEPDVEDEEVVEGGDLDESNEDEDEGLDKSGEEEGAFSPSIHQKNRIGIAITTARRLLGVSFHLPMKVMVDVPSERTSQLVWMKKHSSTQASLYFTNPLLSKIKSCNFHQRQWNLSESGGSDGVPCLSLELGVKDKSSNLRRIIDFDDEVEEEEEGRWGGRVSSEVTPTQAQSPRGAPRIILPPPAATDPRPLPPFLPPPLAMPSLPLHLERKMTPIELVSRVTAMELARRLLDAEERLSSSEMREMEMGKRLVQMSDEMTRLKRQRESS